MTQLTQLCCPSMVAARSTIQKTEPKMAIGTQKALHTIPYCCKVLRSATKAISYHLLVHMELQTCTTLLLLHRNKNLQKPNLLAVKAASTSASCIAALVFAATQLVPLEKRKFLGD